MSNIRRNPTQTASANQQSRKSTKRAEKMTPQVQRASQGNTISNDINFYFVQAGEEKSAPARQHAAWAASQRRYRNAAPEPSLTLSTAQRVASEGWACKKTVMSANSLDDERTHTDVTDMKLARTRGGYQAKAVSDPRLLSPLLVCTAGAVDPFDMYQVKLDKYTHSLIMFGFENSISTTHYGEVLATGQIGRNHRLFAGLEARIRYCLTDDKTDLLAFLAVAASRLTNMSTCTPFIEKQSNLYMYRAVNSMRQQLGSVHTYDAINADIFGAIVKLAAAEWLRGSQAAARFHMKFLKGLAAHLHLTDIGARSAYYTACYYDVLISAEADSVPLLTERHWQPLPISKERLIRIQDENVVLLRQPPQSHRYENATMPTAKGLTHETRNFCSHFPASNPSSPDDARTSEKTLRFISSPPEEPMPRESGFQELVRADCFSPDLSRTITSDLEPWRTVAIHCFSQPRADVTNAQWMNQTGLAILHKLLSRSEQSRLKSLRKVGMEEAVRLTLIIAVAQICSPTFWRTAAANAKRLKRVVAALERLEYPWLLVTTSNSPPGERQSELVQQSRAEARLALWILVVGLAVCDDAEDREWFITRAASLAVRLGVTRQEDVYKLMDAFLHVRGNHVNDLALRIAHHD